MKTYALRLTADQWMAVEDGLRLLPNNQHARTALQTIKVANEVAFSIEREGEDGDDGNSERGNGNGSDEDGDGPVLSAAPAMSRKEVLILKFLMDGMSNKEIARKMVITESTVKVHMKAVLRKLRLGNRTQAAVWAKTNLSERIPNGSGGTSDIQVSGADRAQA